MNIYVVRHGQTNWNIAKKMQGITDIPLNVQGEEQARKVRRKLQDINFDIIFSSPLSRAIKTANIATNGKEIIIDNRLQEFNYGINEGKKHEEFDYNRVWNMDNPVIYDNAESINDLIKRVYEFFDELKKNDYNNVLIFTHNGVMRIINTYFNGIPEDKDLKAFKVDNCQIIKYVI